MTAGAIRGRANRTSAEATRKAETIRNEGGKTMGRTIRWLAIGMAAGLTLPAMAQTVLTDKNTKTTNVIGAAGADDVRGFGVLVGEYCLRHGGQGQTRCHSDGQPSYRPSHCFTSLVTNRFSFAGRFGACPVCSSADGARGHQRTPRLLFGDRLAKAASICQTPSRSSVA